MAEFSLSHRTIPAREGAGPHPGLLLLHGRGTDENDLLPLGRELDPRLFTVSARGPLAYPWGGHAWYDLDPRGVGYPEAITLASSIRRLDTFLDEIISAYPIDPRRLYVAGFSMGAAMSATLALLFPDRVAGAALLSGYLPLHNDLPFRVHDVAGYPMFEAHGVFDAVIPLQWGRVSRDSLLEMGVDLEYHEYPIQHEISTDELTEFSSWLRKVIDRLPEDASVQSLSTGDSAP